MKMLIILICATNICLSACGQTNTNAINNPNNQQDSINEVMTIGIFEGVLIAKTGYKINEYYIAYEDMTKSQVDSLKGYRVIVKGKLKIVKGNENGNIQNISEDRKYITSPKFTYYIYKEPEGFITH